MPEVYDAEFRPIRCFQVDCEDARGSGISSALRALSDYLKHESGWIHAITIDDELNRLYVYVEEEE